MEKSNRLCTSTGLRILADLIDAAKANGATHEPHVYASANGCFIDLRFPGEAPGREIAAWQLATDTVWDVRSTTFHGPEGEALRSQHVKITCQDVHIDLSIVTPVPAEAAA